MRLSLAAIGIALGQLHAVIGGDSEPAVAERCASGKTSDLKLRIPFRVGVKFANEDGDIKFGPRSEGQTTDVFICKGTRIVTRWALAENFVPDNWSLTKQRNCTLKADQDAKGVLTPLMREPWYELKRDGKVVEGAVECKDTNQGWDLVLKSERFNHWLVRTPRGPNNKYTRVVGDALVQSRISPLDNKGLLPNNYLSVLEFPRTVSERKVITAFPKVLHQCVLNGSFASDKTPQIVLQDTVERFKLGDGVKGSGPDAPKFECKEPVASCPDQSTPSRVGILLEGSSWRMRTNMKTSGNNAVDIWGPRARQVFEFPCGKELIMRFDSYMQYTKVQNGELPDEPRQTVVCRYAGQNRHGQTSVHLGVSNEAAAQFPDSFSFDETWSCEYKSWAEKLDDWKLMYGDQLID